MFVSLCFLHYSIHLTITLKHLENTHTHTHSWPLSCCTDHCVIKAVINSFCPAAILTEERVHSHTKHAQREVHGYVPHVHRSRYLPKKTIKIGKYYLLLIKIPKHKNLHFFFFPFMSLTALRLHCQVHSPVPHHIRLNTGRDVTNHECSPASYNQIFSEWRGECTLLPKNMKATSQCRTLHVHHSTWWNIQLDEWEGKCIPDQRGTLRTHYIKPATSLTEMSDVISFLDFCCTFLQEKKKLILIATLKRNIMTIVDT